MAMSEACYKKAVAQLTVRLQRCFLKSINGWKIVESGWIKLEDTTDELTVA
jgi:hypothetical protein